MENDNFEMNFEKEFNKIKADIKRRHGENNEKLNIIIYSYKNYFY